MATWPTRFPRAQRRAYQGQTEMAVKQTKFPSSTKRRRVFEDAWTVIGLEMIMDDEQFEHWWSWLRYKADEGADVINMPLLDSDDTITNIDGFIVPNSISWSYEETVWRVSFDFRIASFTLPTEAALDTWLAG